MSIDAILLSLLAVADLGLIFSLRRTRSRRAGERRVMRSLEMSIQREIGWADAPPKHWYISRAS
jgi:hypothetical protein